MSKLLYVGLASCFLGLISLFAEKTFYNSVSPEGVLQESLFLPLGYVLLAIGVFLFIAGCLKMLFSASGSE